MQHDFYIDYSSQETLFFDFSRKLFKIMQSELKWGETKKIVNITLDDGTTIQEEKDFNLSLETEEEMGVTTYLIWQDKTYDFGIQITYEHQRVHISSGSGGIAYGPRINFIIKEDNIIKPIFTKKIGETTTAYINLITNPRRDNQLYSFGYSYSLNKTALILGLGKNGGPPNPFLILAKDNCNKKYMICGADFFIRPNLDSNGTLWHQYPLASKVGVIAKCGEQNSFSYINSSYKDVESRPTIASPEAGAMPFLFNSYSIIPLLSQEGFFPEVFSIFSMPTFSKTVEESSIYPLLYKEGLYFQQVGAVGLFANYEDRGKSMYPLWAIPIEKEERSS